MSEKIEFYKNRGIGERFSVAVDFLTQNWKALYKNILIGGFPFAIIMGYLIAQIANVRPVGVSDLPRFLLFYVFLLLISFITNIFLYSMTGAVLSYYDRNQLNESTGWNDLKDTFFRFAGKITLISLLVAISVGIIMAVFAVILGSVASFSLSGMRAGFFILLFLFILIFLGIFLALAPSISIMYFPACFSGKTTVESIKIAFKLGFKNWGSLFVAILLAGVVLATISVVFSLPYEVAALFSGHLSIVSYILATLSAIGTLLISPIVTVIFAFQYFSIVEKDEGVSLQSKVDEFENL